MDSLKEHITVLEKQFWKAQEERDLKFFDEKLADDAVTIAGFGFADKRTIIHSIALGAIQFASHLMSDERVHELGAEAASISYRCVIQAAVQGQPHTIVVNVTTVYVQRDGAWKIVLHQQTPAAR